VPIIETISLPYSTKTRPSAITAASVRSATMAWTALGSRSGMARTSGWARIFTPAAAPRQVSQTKR
jgi:hypothetical protein